MSLVTAARPLLRSEPMGREEPAPVRAEESPAARDDAALVAAVAQGSREALGAIYDLHAPLLFGLAKRMLGSAAAAEDLLHDLFLEVWQHAAEYTAERGSVRTWLLVRARSRALDRLGRGAREARATERLSTEQAPAVVSALSSSLDVARLRRLVGTLPAELVAVLDLTYGPVRPSARQSTPSRRFRPASSSPTAK
jgi:RNA polymerase sigma-70 factor (ECF subfamily)